MPVNLPVNLWLLECVPLGLLQARRCRNAGRSCSFAQVRFALTQCRRSILQACQVCSCKRLLQSCSADAHGKLREQPRSAAAAAGTQQPGQCSCVRGAPAAGAAPRSSCPGWAAGTAAWTAASGCMSGRVQHLGLLRAAASRLDHPDVRRTLKCQEWTKPHSRRDCTASSKRWVAG